MIPGSRQTARRVAPLLVLGLLVAAGCASAPASAPTATSPATAVTVAPTATATPVSTATGVPTPTPTATPSSTPMPTCTPSPTPTPAPPALSVEPSVVSLAVGQTERVEVRAQSLGPLTSIEMHLSYDPGYIRIDDSAPEVGGVQVELGDLPHPSDVLQRSADNGSGLVVYQVAQAADSEISGSGLVTAFTVRALAEGGSPLRVALIRLGGPDGQMLDAPDPVDGLVIISNAMATQAAATAAPAGAEAPTAAASPAATAAPIATPTPPSGPVYHTVQAGENLFRIALRYQTTVAEIMAANGLADSDTVRVGQVLLIPAAGAAPQASSGDTYVVQAGDTLFSIARRHDTTVDALAALNGLAAPYSINAGQVLRLR